MLRNEEEVKQILGINDFRNISKQKLVAFVSSIPDMDKECAIKCIEQFPHFKEYSEYVVGRLYEMYNAAVSENTQMKQTAIAAYMLVLNDLSSLVNQDAIPAEDKGRIAEKMVDVANGIAEVEQRNEHFLRDVLNKFTAAGVGALMLAGTVIGVKFIKR